MTTARPAEPVSIEAASQSATVVGGALRSTEAAAATLAQPPGPALQARLAAAPDPERRARVAGFLQARRGAEEAHRRVAAAVAAAQAATGPVTRIRALAGADVPGLQAAAAQLFAAAKALRADPALGHLLPPAFGPGPQAAGAAFGRKEAPPRTGGLPSFQGPNFPPKRSTPTLDDLPGAVKAIEPLHVYTASRLPHLAAGLALAKRGVQPPAEPYEAMLIALALGHLFGQQPPAAALATEAGTAAGQLQRGLLAARAPSPTISATQLVGLAIPLTQLPARCAPFPVLQDLFPKLSAGAGPAAGQRLSLVG